MEVQRGLSPDEVVKQRPIVGYFLPCEQEELFLPLHAPQVLDPQLEVLDRVLLSCMNCEATAAMANADAKFRRL